MQIQYLFIIIFLFLGSCQVEVVKQGEYWVLVKKFRLRRFSGGKIYIHYRDLPEKAISASQQKELETSIIDTVKENLGQDFKEK